VTGNILLAYGSIKHFQEECLIAQLFSPRLNRWLDDQSLSLYSRPDAWVRGGGFFTDPSASGGISTTATPFRLFANE